MWKIMVFVVDVCVKFFYADAMLVTNFWPLTVVPRPAQLCHPVTKQRFLTIIIRLSFLDPTIGTYISFDSIDISFPYPPHLKF